MSDYDYDEWLRTHKGPLIDTRGGVWDCGDDWCGCSRAEVVTRYRNLQVPGAIIPIAAWEGPFHTDHESGAEDDLDEYRKSLTPEQAARIIWPTP